MFVLKKKLSLLYLVVVFIVGILPVSNTIKLGFIIMLVIVSLSTALLPQWLTILVMFSACFIFSLASPTVILSGFISSASWLVLSGIIWGMILRFNNIDLFFAYYVSKFCKTSFKQIILTIITFGTLLIFIMPSAMGRVVLIIPILQQLSLKLGYDKNSKEAEAILTSGVLSTYLLGFFVLPANIPNNVLSGLMQNLYGIKLSYLNYLITFFPIMAIGEGIILFCVIVLFYRNCENAVIKRSNQKERMNKKQFFVLCLLTLTIVLWLTEDVTHIPAGWSGMGTAIICLLPNYNLLPNNPFQKINFIPFFYVSGIISLGALTQTSGLAQKIINNLFKIVSTYHFTSRQYMFYWVFACLIIGLIVTQPGVPAVMTALMKTYSLTTNIPLQTLANLQVLGFSTIIFPYQAPPLIVALDQENISLKRFSFVCSITTLTSLVIFGLMLVWTKFI